jgi:hypothetical protein
LQLKERAWEQKGIRVRWLQRTRAKKGGVANVAIKHTSPINLGSPMAKIEEVNILTVSGEQSP